LGSLQRSPRSSSWILGVGVETRDGEGKETGEEDRGGGARKNRKDRRVMTRKGG